MEFKYFWNSFTDKVWSGLLVSHVHELFFCSSHDDTPPQNSTGHNAVLDQCKEDMENKRTSLLTTSATQYSTTQIGMSMNEQEGDSHVLLVLYCCTVATILDTFLVLSAVDSTAWLRETTR